ncbi:MAG: glycosyltransferase family 2 protein [Calditrichaeota bacterium]|nr:glycosyltransferase family 2 protein [Calditrichota bacterium]
MNHKTSAENQGDSPFVSVVIPSYNSSIYISQCLEAIRAQQTRYTYEVIMVDSSSDRTEQIVARDFPEVRLVHLDRQTFTGMARNIGVEYARGEIVLFIDTDCIAPPGWIEKMCNAIQSSATRGICGSLENGTPWSITGSVGYYLEFFRFLPSRGKPYETFFLVGGNSGFRKTVFDNIRFLNTNIGDDVAFSQELKTQGSKLMFFPDIPVRHLNKSGLRRMLNYQHKLGLGACRYRRVLSPGIMKVLQKLPLLTFLLPNAIMIWIAAVVLHKRGIAEFLKFLLLLPVSYLANMNWALGFYRELRQQNLNTGKQSAGTDVREEIPAGRKREH